MTCVTVQILHLGSMDSSKCPICYLIMFTDFVLPSIYNENGCVFMDVIPNSQNYDIYAQRNREAHCNADITLII